MHRSRGFTLLELMVVVAIAALATAGATLALRDGEATQLEREALRLSAMLEAARAQSRTTGVPVVWRARPEGFEFVDVRPRPDTATGSTSSIWGPRNWLAPETRAQIIQPPGAQTLVLGPEPLIAAQRLTLQLGERSLMLTTDGLSPFAVAAPEVAP